MNKIKNRYTGAVICSGECSIRDLAENNKAKLYGANLSGVNLAEADLRRSFLSRSCLSESELFGAELNGADLYGADLRKAKYGGEELLKYLSINPIGSRNDALQVWITKDSIFLSTGCWSGTPEKLLERTEREDYRLTVQYILGMAEMVRKEVHG